MYDAAITILYISSVPYTNDCLAQYTTSLHAQQLAVEELLSVKCTRTIDVPIAVTSLSSSLTPSSTSPLTIQGILKYRINPSHFAPRLFDLCGLTIDTIFDLSVPSTDQQVKNVAKLTGTNGTTCPELDAMESHSERGILVIQCSHHISTVALN